MAKYGSDQVTLTMRDGVDGAGTYRDLSADTLEFPGVDKQVESEESHGFGDDWVEVLSTGLKRVADITLKGFYDDTAGTGTHALLNRVGSKTEILVTWGGAKTTEMNVLIKNYRRQPARGALTKFEAVLLVDGEPTEV